MNFIAGIIIGFLLVTAGFLAGWCARVGLTRAQQNLPDAKYKNGLIGRWE